MSIEPTKKTIVSRLRAVAENQPHDLTIHSLLEAATHIELLHQSKAQSEARARELEQQLRDSQHELRTLKPDMEEERAYTLRLGAKVRELEAERDELKRRENHRLAMLQMVFDESSETGWDDIMAKAARAVQEVALLTPLVADGGAIAHLKEAARIVNLMFKAADNPWGVVNTQSLEGLKALGAWIKADRAAIVARCNAVAGQSKGALERVEKLASLWTGADLTRGYGRAVLAALSGSPPATHGRTKTCGACPCCRAIGSEGGEWQCDACDGAIHDAETYCGEEQSPELMQPVGRESPFNCASCGHKLRCTDAGIMLPCETCVDRSIISAAPDADEPKAEERGWAEQRSPHYAEIKKLYERRLILTRRDRMGTAESWHYDELQVVSKKIDELELAEKQWLESNPSAGR